MLKKYTLLTILVLSGTQASSMEQRQLRQRAIAELREMLETDVEINKLLDEARPLFSKEAMHRRKLCLLFTGGLIGLGIGCCLKYALNQEKIKQE